MHNCSSPTRRETLSPLAVRSLRLLGFTVMFSLLPFLSPLAGQTYGYKKAEDPLIKGVKKAIQQVRTKKFDQLDASIEGLRWQLDELKDDIQIDLSAKVESARKSRDARQLSYVLTELVFQATLQKFYWNQKEKLSKFRDENKQLLTSEFYYDEMLSHTVMRADKSLKLTRHRLLKQEFKSLRKTLGSTGLFGVGKRPVDVEGFTRHAKRIEELLREVFTDFSTRPGSVPTPPKEGD